MKLEIEVEFRDGRANSDARRTEGRIGSKLNEICNEGLIKEYHIKEVIERC